MKLNTIKGDLEFRMTFGIDPVIFPSGSHMSPQMKLKGAMVPIENKVKYLHTKYQASAYKAESIPLQFWKIDPQFS